MVRRLRDISTTEDEIVIDTPLHKRHKRHKHKKHKKRRYEDEFDSDTSIDVSYEDALDKPYKQKAKTSREIPGTSAADLLKAQTLKVVDPRKPLPGSSSSTPPKPTIKKKKAKGKDSGTSSEEERWLDAIKSGKLEEVDDELKKIKPKDPKMMTARQRAMYDRGVDKDPGGEVLLALPSGYKEKVMTAEAIQKAALKSQKRKQLADEKREKDKKKTMDRLLKKQESKILKNASKSKSTKSTEPMIIYKINYEGASLTLPPGVPFPLEPRSAIDPPKPVKCNISDCTNLKKYNCSRTGVPLCSLDCYKRNLALVT